MNDDVYTHGHTDAVLRSHRWRTAENSAAYLLPHLSGTSSILDVGCGPGTITADLASIARDGQVIGIDRSADVIAEAATGAPGNVRYEVGDVYALGFDDATFDVVHAHQVLQHLSDPVAALREMARVCRPGGLVAIRDADYAGFTWYPSVPELDGWLDLYHAVARGNRAEPDAGRRLKAWVAEAGLELVESSASTWCFADRADVEWWGGLWADRITGSDLARQAVDRSLATAADLDRLADGWRRWAASDDAWFVVLHGEVLARPGRIGRRVRERS